MSSDPSGRRSAQQRRSIPLRDYASSPDQIDRGDRTSGTSSQQADSRHHQAYAETPNLPGISTYWDQPYDARSDDGVSPVDMAALQAALPPDFHQSTPDAPSVTPSDLGPYVTETQFFDEGTTHYFPESDTVPLTSRAEPMPGSLTTNGHESQPRDSFQTVSDVDNNTARGRDTLQPDRDVERGHSHGRQRSYGMSLGVDDYRSSRPSSTSGSFLRAGSSMVRAMSQRVVNISGESDAIEQRASRHRSKSPQGSERNRSREPSPSPLLDTAYHSQTVGTPPEKVAEEPYEVELPPLSRPRTRPRLNPLKGRTLGIFGPDNHIRLWLCDLLVKPYTEPLILLLIVLQTVLLAVESGPNVFLEGNGRPERWGQRPIDWAMLGLFIVFTLELIARIIVSGFILNAAEYSTIDRKKGVRAAIADQYRAVFQPERQKSVKSRRQVPTEPSAIARSFTTLMQGQQALPATFEEHQRFQLARRAFLRHSFNRLDVVSVLSFWVAFVLGITGIEHQYHLYVFKMLSCLRILRLLALTNGTSIILRSLKKAAPLLLRVAFLIGFFWLLFAIIGVQSFKASLSRQCVWLDPQDPENLEASYTNEFQFCGGYLDNITGRSMPWVKMDSPDSLRQLTPGTANGKGFLCPRGSICLEREGPFNDTVNFDNIIQSLELVFVIMSANTFSTLMYYTMGSDYSMAALFFGFGVVFLTLWLVNLLIAVITSSFQVIREESKSSAFTADHEPLSQPSAEDEFRRLSLLQRIYEKTKLFWVVVIAFGLLSQAFRDTDMSDSTEIFIDTAEVVVTIVLDVEIIIRLACYWRKFHRSWHNLVDLGLAIITSIILIPPIRESRAYAWLSVFQIIRTYRVVLAIPVTRKLILLVLGNAAGIANLMLFVFLMTFLAAILAAQLFRGEIPLEDDGELNSVSFYTIFNSFLGMYQVLTSESWTNILYAVTSYTTSRTTAWIGATFLIGWFILSFFILINMFIAVIQENFDISEDEKRLEQIKAFLQRKELGSSSSTLALSTIFTFGKSRQRKDPLDYGPAMTEMLLKDAVVREFLDDPVDNGQDKSGDQPHPPLRTGTTLLGEVRPGTLSKLWGKFVRRITKREPNPFYSNLTFNNPNEVLDARQMAQQAVSASAARRKAQREYLARYPAYNHSLFIFRPKSRIRRLCQRLVGPARGVERFDGVEPNKIAWYTFSAVIYAAIVAMVIIACVTTPLFQKEYQEAHEGTFLYWYVWTDLAFAVVFTVESVIKIIADGFFSTPNAYLRSSWGAIDAIVLITLWISVVTLLINDGHISRAVGAFKALRALRLLNVSNSARDTFHSLIIVGWWKLLAAAFISISLLIPFAIYGLNLFNGLMFSCNDSDGISILNECFGEFDSVPFSDDWPLLAPRVASNPYFGFDDFTSSLLTLFQIVSQEGWTDASFAAQAITGRGMQPRDLASEGNALFFVIFNLLATVFVLTLFISVFMRNYTEQTGVAFLTAEQRSWLELRKLLLQISPSKSSYNNAGRKTWKRWCHRRAIEKRGKWYRAVTIALVLHLMLLMSEFRDEPQWWSDTRSYLFLALVLFYMANLIIRIIGLGWSRFRRSSWDLYSLAAVIPAFFSTTVMLSIETGRETATQVHKFFLVALVLLLIPRNDALDQLFKTAAASLTAIGNLLATWLVLFIGFAIAFTQAFSLTRFGEEGQSDINFRTVPKALILLFRLSLGEGWNKVMEEYAAIEPPLCVDDGTFFDSDCGSKAWARFLFIAWNILSMYIFVNLFISLIYESFSYVYQRSSGVAAVDRDEIRRFKEAWRSVDPDGTGAISKEAFPRLLGELSGVFQMRIYDPEDSVRQILEDVRQDVRASYHTSLAATGSYGDIDIKKLNDRLGQLDVAKIRERRRRYEIFYEEVLVGADPDRGITFTNVLMILAHYNIINDSKSLKLDEFLRRRARLQRVDDSVRRKTVQGFFDTIYWTRKFKKHIDAKRSARMTTIPQLDIPDIFVDDGAGEAAASGQGSTAQPMASSQHLSVDGSQRPRGSSVGSLGPGSQAPVPQHPLSYPRSSTSSSSPPMSPSGFSFDLHESSGHEAYNSEMRQRSDPVSPTQARDMLDDSVWLDSIRRSTTNRRSDRGSYRYTDIR